jgi:O-antigen ligase
LIGFAIALPVSISIAEAFLFLMLAWWLAGLRRRWKSALAEPMWWPVVAFAAAAAATVLWSVRPEATLHRMHRLLIPFAIFAVADIIGADRPSGAARARATAGWFVVACCARAVYDIVRVSRGVSSGAELFSLGTMRDPQMYLVAMAWVLAVAPMPGWRRWRPFLACAGGLLGMGLLLHWKRGVWAAIVVAAAWLGIRTRRWRMLLAIGALVVAALLLPAIRGRLVQLEDLRQAAAGGRRALWQDAAPALLPQYPMGMGWCAVTHDDLAAHTPYLQPGLNHLHNNLLQITLETGWLGLACWLVWMGSAWILLYRLSRGNREDEIHAPALGLWTAFTGLLLNGMVEYNFGDTEILMLFCLLIGLASGLRRLTR